MAMQPGLHGSSCLFDWALVSSDVGVELWRRVEVRSRATAHRERGARRRCAVTAAVARNVSAIAVDVSSSCAARSADSNVGVGDRRQVDVACAGC